MDNWAVRHNGGNHCNGAKLKKKKLKNEDNARNVWDNT